MYFLAIYFVITQFFMHNNNKQSQVPDSVQKSDQKLTQNGPKTIPMYFERVDGIQQMKEEYRKDYKMHQSGQLNVFKNTPSRKSGRQNTFPEDTTMELRVYLSKSFDVHAHDQGASVESIANPSGNKPSKDEDLKVGRTDATFNANSAKDGREKKEDSLMHNEEKVLKFHDDEDLLWLEKEVPYSMSEDVLQMELNITFTEEMLKLNETLYAHVYLTRKGHSPYALDPTYHPSSTVHRVIPLMEYVAKSTVKEEVAKSNLWSGEKNQAALNAMNVKSEKVLEDVNEMVGYWKPSFRINPVVYHEHVQDNHPFVATMAQHWQVDLKSGNYLPVVYLNEFWTLHQDKIRINETKGDVILPLRMEYYPISMNKLFMYAQMTAGFDNDNGFSTGKDPASVDKLKKMFLDTNPYLLAITALVSLLHTVFDMLAFRNDVSFWKKKKSLQGLSLRAILVNIFFQVVILLYLIDMDTPYMIIFSNVLALVIEIWKINKVITVKRDPNTSSISVETKDNYTESDTAKYDKVAIAHVSYALYPLIFGYSVYNLMYNEHKGWYSWVLTSLTGFVYSFGFIMMTPQLYINYRLKSVAVRWHILLYSCF